MFNHRMTMVWTLSSIILAQPGLIAQQKDSTKKSDDKWDVAASHEPSKEIECETDEGTWISVDISLDGKKVAFDLLGNIYYYAN